MFFSGIHIQGNGPAIGVAQSHFKTFSQTLPCVFTNFQAVNDDINVVFFILVQFGQGINFMNLPVDAQADKALGAQFSEQFKLFPFAVGDNRGQDHQLAFFRHGQHVIDHLRDGLCL